MQKFVIAAVLGISAMAAPAMACDGHHHHKKGAATSSTSHDSAKTHSNAKTK